MDFKSLTRGIEILRPYYDDPNGHHTGAEHDIIYFYKTDRPMSGEDVAEMKVLGFFQEDAERDEEDEDGEDFVYDPWLSWAAFT